MINDFKAIKEDANKNLRNVENDVKNAIIEVQRRHLIDLCNKTKERLAKIQAEIDSSNKQFEADTKDIIKRKKKIDMDGFKAKLSYAILILENNLRTTGSLKEGVKLLKDLGRENVVIENIANSLLDDELIDINVSANTIHSNVHKSIRKARFGAFVDNNQGFVRYYLMALLCVMFGSFRFPKHLREYIDNDNTRLVNNLRRLDYLIEAMKERQYEDAWNEIDGLTVLYIIA